MITSRLAALTLLASWLPSHGHGALREARSMKLHSPRGQYRLSGPLGERVAANTQNWLLPAPQANPGMLEMFRLRDRQPPPDLVPWAGEFVGKYLTSAIGALRLTDDPRLREHVAAVIVELIGTQAEDGYLGPFPKQERLLGHWDLWGHYHCLVALLLWHEETGDEAALACARRVADLVCAIYLDTGRRMVEAGSTEMNLSIIHALGWLYRTTGEDRYLRLVRQIEKEWEDPAAGDYLRSALAGTDFYRTPKPRWESLHGLQGLVELWRITGDERYRRAFIQHWTSIRNYDRHPTGGFTTGEQAVGNPYSQGAIETCCTIAWMVLSTDMLRLTGDSTVADELELSTWNALLGAQHPSGRWWTYDTPPDGVRAASAHAIVFQARFGTPELNCCSVNGPRGLGMLPEWAVMVDEAGPVVNFYGAGTTDIKLADGSSLRLTQETEYPAEGVVRLQVGLDQPRRLNLRLRIPAWSHRTGVAVNGEVVSEVSAGQYLALERDWADGDTVVLRLDMTPRYWTGELGRQGQAAIYRGPLLLAWDQHFSDLDESELPALDLGSLRLREVRAPQTRFAPLVLVAARATDGREVTLCDFATAGAHGTHYRSWLPATGGVPAPFYLKHPRDGEAIAAGPTAFEWTGYRRSAQTGRRFRLVIAPDGPDAGPVVVREGLEGTRVVLSEGLQANGTYRWHVVAVNEHGETLAANGPWRFTVDASLPNTVPPEAEPPVRGPGEVVVASPLDGDGTPSYGTLDTQRDITAAMDRKGNPTGAIACNGATSKLTYEVGEFPGEDYTVCIWACPEGLPTDRNQQIFSAWAVPVDDPLRIVVNDHAVFARIEGSTGAGSEGIRLENGQWVHLAAVKEGAVLTLYVNGEARATCAAPAQLFSAAHNVGVGCNPNFTGGNECFLGRLDDFALYARALTADEIRRLAATGGLE